MRIISFYFIIYFHFYFHFQFAHLESPVDEGDVAHPLAAQGQGGSVDVESTYKHENTMTTVSNRIKHEPGTRLEVRTEEQQDDQNGWASGGGDELGGRVGAHHEADRHRAEGRQHYRHQEEQEPVVGWVQAHTPVDYRAVGNYVVCLQEATKYFKTIMSMYSKCRS